MIIFTSFGGVPILKKKLILIHNEGEMTKKSQYMTVKEPVNLCAQADKLREKSAYKEAISGYLNALMLDRESPDSYYGLGVCYKHLEKYSKAIHYLEKAAEIDEKKYETFYELGVCHLLKGIPCGAIKNFVKAVQLDPQNPEAILQLGISHELCEEYDMALMIYQKLIENSPEYIKAYDHKSSLLMKMERYKEASLVLNQIMKLDATYHKAFFGIGVCFDKLGKKMDAQRYYRKFLINRPDASQASFVRDRMQKIRLQKSVTAPFVLV